MLRRPHIVPRGLADILALSMAMTLYQLNDALVSESGITMVHFHDGDWHWGWSNYGNNNAGGGITQYRNRLLAGAQ